MHDSIANVTAKILGFSVKAWSGCHQAFWRQMAFTFLREERESLLIRWQGSWTEVKTRLEGRLG